MPFNTVSANAKRASRGLLAAAVLSLAVAATARAAVPTVLPQLPDDARAVLVISNVKDLGTKVSNIAVRLNLPAPPDLAGYVTRLAGITKGFDANNSAALVILAQPKGEDPQPGPPPMVALLPTSDPKAMMEGFQPGDPDKAGISEVNLPNDRAEKGYIATVGAANGPRWVALATDRGALESFLAKKAGLDKTLTPEALKVFEANDAVIWGNIPALTRGMDKMLEDKEQDITGMLDLMNLRTQQDPLMSALQKAAINEYFLALKQYLSDATSAMVTVRLSDAGANLGLVGSFKPDSPFGKFVAAQKPAKPLSLQGLPGGDFLMAGAFAIDSASVSSLFGDVAKRIATDEVVAKSPKAKALATILDQYQQLVKLISGTEFIILPPAPGGGAKNGLINGAYLIDTESPEKVMAIQNEVLQNPIVVESMIPDIKQDLKVTPDAVTIKGVKLSKIHMTYTLREEPAGGDKPVSEMAKQQIQLIQKMYGSEGMTMYSGIVGKRVLFIIGSDAAILDAAVAAAQSNSNELVNNPAITGAKDQVVASPIGVAYVSMTRFISVMMSAMMPGAPPAPAAGGAPMVMSAGVNATTLTMELHVPTTTITAVKDMIQDMRMRGSRRVDPAAAVECNLDAEPGKALQPEA